MKTKMLGLVLALFTTLTVTTAKAQCSINNMLSCQISINFIEHTNACNALVCSSSNNMVIMPGITTLPCSGGCPTFCKEIQIIMVNTTVITPVSVNSSGPISAPMPGNCSSTLAFFESSTGNFVVK